MMRLVLGFACHRAAPSGAIDGSAMIDGAAAIDASGSDDSTVQLVRLCCAQVVGQF
jgi:hypothetical protein